MRFRYALCLIISLVLLATGCSTVGDFYEEMLPAEYIDPESYLPEGEEPSVYYSSDIASDIYFLRSNYYWILGSASYNGPNDSSLPSEIASLCKEKGARIGLYTSQYTDTRHGIISSSYSISSYSIDRYDYLVVLFVPMSLDDILYCSRVGLSTRDLETSDRISLGQNTGAYVSIVYQDSPAFYANLAPGDIITEANGVTIYDSASLDNIFNSLTSEDTIELKYVRNGIERECSFAPLF